MMPLCNTLIIDDSCRFSLVWREVMASSTILKDFCIF